MIQSIEAYFLMNLLADFALIALVARLNGCLNLKRAAAGSFLSAGYACIVISVSERFAHPLIQLVLLILLGLIVSGNPDPRFWSVICIQLACGALLLGGAGLLLPPTAGSAPRVVALLLGLILLTILLRIRSSRLTTWDVTVCLRFHGKDTSFRALIDTGNRLREPISGLPVLIAESALLADIMPAPGDKGCRSVAFGGLGGSGTIRCFHPDLVLIRRGEHMIQAPEVWVAIYPGKIPGNTRALAPPSFAVIPGKSS